MITIHREDRFDFRSAEYARLYERSDATPFQHPQWLHRLYETLAPEVGAEPVIVTGRDAEGQLRFLLPLVRRRVRFVRRVEFADLGVSDYAAPVIERAFRVAVLAPETGVAVRKAIGRADLIVVEKISADPQAFVRLLGGGSVRRHSYDAHAIKLPDSFAAWRESLDPKVARHVDRKRKRVGQNGRRLQMRELDSPEEVDPAFEEMRVFRQARFGGRRAIDLVQQACYFDFYRQVARDSMRGTGPASTSLLTINDETVGVSFSVHDTQQELFLLIGYDFARYRNYSLGLIMVEELIAAAIADDKRYYDLTIGHDGYKTDFGAAATAMYAVRSPRTVRGRAGLMADDGEAAARRLAKRGLRYWATHRPKEPMLRRLRRKG